MKFFRLLTVFLFVYVCVAQSSPGTSNSAPPPAAPAQAGSQSPAVSHDEDEAVQESHITPQQADELFRSVDEILKFVSQDTGLPIRHPVKRALASREQVEKYIADRTDEDGDAERMKRSEEVLKRLSLIPRDFDLRGFMISLMKEQVAGYYNSKDQTVYLLDWVDPEQQKSVLAHELTHALQDQNFGLEKFSKSALSGRDGKLNGDERDEARTAVVEGQGMVVMIDYVLSPTGQTIADSPQLADAIQASMASGPEMKVFSGAPFYLQKLLLFPYSHGLSFERELLEKRGKEAAFAGVFRNPPADTHQIMEPADYLAGKTIPPLVPPDFSSAVKGKYKSFDIGTLGEFDISTLIAYFSGRKAAGALGPDLRGAYYYAAEAKPTGDSLPAVAVVTHWTDAASASQFAGIYAAAIPHRYAAAKIRTPEAAEELAVRSKPIPNTNLAVAVTPRLTSPAAWDSAGGPLYVESHGNTVLVMEGFDEQTAAKIRAKVFPDEFRS